MVGHRVGDPGVRQGEVPAGQAGTQEVILGSEAWQSPAGLSSALGQEGAWLEQGQGTDERRGVWFFCCEWKVLKHVACVCMWGRGKSSGGPLRARALSTGRKGPPGVTGGGEEGGVLMCVFV